VNFKQYFLRENTKSTPYEVSDDVHQSWRNSGNIEYSFIYKSVRYKALATIAYQLQYKIINHIEHPIMSPPVDPKHRFSYLSPNIEIVGCDIHNIHSFCLTKDVNIDGRIVSGYLDESEEDLKEFLKHIIFGKIIQFIKNKNFNKEYDPSNGTFHRLNDIAEMAAKISHRIGEQYRLHHQEETNEL